MSKNYCQDGVAPSTQFGKGGPRFKSVSGALHARDAGDTAFAVVSGADPIADDDFVTKRWGQANLGGAVAGSAGAIYESLQAYVDSGDRNSYNPSVGTPTDIMGNLSAGAIVANTVYADGAFLFDGASGNVNFVKDADTDNIFDTGGTVMVFFNPVNSGEGNFGRLLDTTDSVSEGYALFMDNGATGVNGLQFFRHYTTTIGQWDTNSRPYQRLGWNSAALTFNDADGVGAVPAFYAQGQPVASAQTGVAPVGTPVSDSGNNLYIGGSLDDTRTFNGQIAIVFMWDRILTDEEIAQAHNNFFDRFTRKGSVVGVIRRPSVGGVSDDILADKGADSPTIAITALGGDNINFQSETTTSRGIFGSNTSYAAILSGRNNIIRDNNDFCVIAGGVDNEIDNTGQSDSGILSGSNNTLGDASNSVICGGNNSLIKPGSGSISFGAICGGERNDITGGSNSFIGGGEDNECGQTGFSGTTDWSAICGGDTNQIRGDFGFIGGGFSNSIGAAVSASAQYATIPGGRSNQIGGANVAGQRGDYGFASGRQSRVLFDGCTVMSDGNAVNADSIVAHEHFLKFAGGIRRLTTNGFNGEAWVDRNDHATTTTTTTHNNAIGTLTTDQHNLTWEVTVASIQDTGRSSKGEKFLVQATRDTTVQVLFTSLGTVGVGAAVTDITYGFDVSGDDVRINITDSVGNNYQHNWLVTKQEGGFAS